jgi:hypothetical protein
MQGPLPEYGPARHWHWHVGAGPEEAQDLSTATGTASGITLAFLPRANGSGSLSGGKPANGPPAWGSLAGWGFATVVSAKYYVLVLVPSLKGGNVKLNAVGVVVV